MEKITCKNGHFYDPEKHTNCPYCGIEINDFIINRDSHTADYSTDKDVESYGKTLPLQDFLAGKQVEEKVEPVVGWIVVISGKNRGRDYHILTGRNRIGRLVTNEIVLDYDESVEQSEHANILYDPNSNCFYLALGGGRGLVYLNGELISSRVELNRDDHILVGKTEFIFTPFCSSTFQWYK